MLPIATSASKPQFLRGRKHASPQPGKPTIAFLSYSTGEFDARTFRMAESAIEAGYRVRVYSRWHPGQLPREDRGEYELIRVPFDWRLAVPYLRAGAERQAAAAMAAAPAAAAAAAAAAAEADADADAGTDQTSEVRGAPADSVTDMGRTPAAARRKRAGPATHRPSWLRRRVRRTIGFAIRTAKGTWRFGQRAARFGSRAWRSPRTMLSLPRRILRRLRRRPFGHLWKQLVMFPLGPRGWAVALESAAEPADIWHGMWAGSLPALERMRAKHGGRTIYDSRDIFMESRDWARLWRPIRSVLQRLERQWAQSADVVLTVNGSYARILEDLLGVPRPPVVMNCQPRWFAPDVRPDLIREALGLGPEVGIALYQGRLQSDRGIEQSMEAILEIPNAVLVLLGFGGWEKRLAAQIANPPYAGRVHLLPAVPPDQLVEWTASADVAVMAIQPSSLNHRWTTPQKLFESLAAGTPVVASDLPGMAEIVKPSGAGLLADPTNPHDIAEKLREILGAPPDEQKALRARVLEAGTERYTWEAQVVTLLRLYRELLGEERAALLRPRLPQSSGPTLHIVDRVGDAVAGDVQVVLDPRWLQPEGEPADTVRSAQSIAEAILRERDLGREAMELLDRWVEQADIVARTSLHGTSFWYGLRLQFWSWVLDVSLWLAVVRRVLDDHPDLVRVACPSDADPPLLEACELLARARGLQLERTPPAGLSPRRLIGETARATNGSRPPDDPVGRLRWWLRPPSVARRQESMQQRLLKLEREEPGRLLVVEAHVLQRINGPDGPRYMNAYLGPIVDQLVGTRLEPIELDLRADLANDDHWARLNGPRAARTLAGDVLTLGQVGSSPSTARALGNRVAAEIAADPARLEVDGIDLGPALRSAVAQRVAGYLPRRAQEITQIRALLRRLRPAGVLIADEYHRQDWLSAAALESVPIAAIQHGVISATHVGYIHRTRTPELRLPDRTYVFGTWERSLLLRESVYRADEVVVGGSPRLDLVAPQASGSEVRRRLGVEAGRRLLVLAGSWGRFERRFYYPIALRNLFDRELEKVELVVKLHPTETDEGPYRAVVAAVAARGGFPAPPITIVQDIDLYELLAAADAHIGINSTVITEAVVVGTPNLLAATLAGFDPLDYVDAGVAIPVRDGGDVLAALGAGSLSIPEAARAAFVAAHFDPGGGSQRIAEDLLAWLSSAPVVPLERSAGATKAS